MILDQCKGVHCVDLGESYQTHIYLQNLASIQPRTSPLKFARSLSTPSRDQATQNLFYRIIYDNEAGRAKLKQVVEDDGWGSDCLWAYVDARDVARACLAWIESEVTIAIKVQFFKQQFHF